MRNEKALARESESLSQLTIVARILAELFVVMPSTFVLDTERRCQANDQARVDATKSGGSGLCKIHLLRQRQQRLLSGQALHLDLNRMEMAYHENHKRDYEITRISRSHVRSTKFNPVALLKLKTNRTVMN